MILETNQPFDLDLTLRCAQGHGWRRDWGPEWRPGEAWYSSVLDGELVYVSQPTGPTGSVLFETEGDKARMEDKLRWQFRLYDDIDDIYHYLTKENTEMGGLVQHYQGLRVMRVDPWECLVFFILAVNNSIEKTHERMDTIAERLGGITLANGRRAFPKPEAVGTISGLDALQQFPQFLDFKQAHNIHEAAKRVRGRPKPDLDPTDKQFLDLYGLKNWASCNDTISELRKLTGVGAKTAASVALFGFGHLDAFPVDSTILGSLKSLYGPKYAGYVSQLLFAFARDYKEQQRRRRR